MNELPYYMDVEEGYPYPVPNCEIEDKIGCWYDSDCKGLKECSSIGICFGESFCDADEAPDFCDVVEKTEPFYGSYCNTD